MANRRPAFVFWDGDTARPKANVAGDRVIKAIRALASDLGTTVDSLKFYTDLSAESNGRLSSSLASELQWSGVSIVDTVSNSRLGGPSKMLLADAFLHVLNDFREKSTIIIISGDPDIGYTISTLRLRGREVALVCPSAAHPTLMRLSEGLSLCDDILFAPFPFNEVSAPAVQSSLVSAMASAVERRLQAAEAPCTTSVTVDVQPKSSAFHGESLGIASQLPPATARSSRENSELTATSNVQCPSVSTLELQVSTATHAPSPLTPSLQSKDPDDPTPELYPSLSSECHVHQEDWKQASASDTTPFIAARKPSVQLSVSAPVFTPRAPQGYGLPESVLRGVPVWFHPLIQYLREQQGAKGIDTHLRNDLQEAVLALRPSILDEAKVIELKGNPWCKYLKKAKASGIVERLKKPPRIRLLAPWTVGLPNTSQN